MLTYILIFILKIIENTLSTLRLIIVSNGKKKIGAILNGFIATVWIFSISITIIDVNKEALCFLDIITEYKLLKYIKFDN